MFGRHIRWTRSCDLIIHKKFIKFHSKWGSVTGIINKINCNHGPKSFAFQGRFPIHTGPTPPLTQQITLDASIPRTFVQDCRQPETAAPLNPMRNGEIFGMNIVFTRISATPIKRRGTFSSKYRNNNFFSICCVGMIYGEFKVCKYDACYYCFECHENEEHVIPARVIHNWDLRKHQVAKRCKLFLLHIEEEPLFNIDETNPTLYNVIKELREVKVQYHFSPVYDKLRVFPPESGTRFRKSIEVNSHWKTVAS